jgi:ParB-like chromosome segregation protein Spo0J
VYAPEYAPRRTEVAPRTEDHPGRLVTCCIGELHPHPSYVRHGLWVPSDQLSALSSSGELAFREPIVVTQDRTIVDGYARWKLAQQQGRTTLPCTEHDLTETEALRWLVQRHRPSRGLNAFTRVLLALDLEPSLREEARSNQQAGGQGKGSSNLTEAERVDVRSEIADVAGVSVGNVTKVKQLLRTAIQELVQAVRRGEISIHGAWLLSKEPPANQREKLALPQCKKKIKKDMRTLGSRHGLKSLPSVPDPSNLTKQLSALESSKPGSFHIIVSNAPGKAICLTRELLLGLGAQRELIHTC